MKIGICGMGLMGSSVARALIPRFPVIGVDPDRASLDLAVQMGVTPAASVTDLVDCDLILLSAPTLANTVLLAELMATGKRIPTADLGSVKRPIVAQWRRDPQYPFIATHPMAGSEFSGAASGSAELFSDCAWPVVVEPDTDPAALDSVIDLVLMLGAHVLPMSAAGHDRAVALASHLPHALAGVLGRIVATCGESELVVAVAGGSFRDATRVSASPPDRTAEFVTANSTDAAVAVRAAAAELAELADLLDDQDSRGVARWLQAGHTIRTDYLNRSVLSVRRVVSGTAVELRDELYRIRDSGASVLARSGAQVEIADLGS